MLQPEDKAKNCCYGVDDRREEVGEAPTELETITCIPLDKYNGTLFEPEIKLFISKESMNIPQFELYQLPESQIPVGIGRSEGISRRCMHQSREMVASRID